jgi:predicted polyphosphate/ATP-dependent NAD kinase
MLRKKPARPWVAGFPAEMLNIGLLINPYAGIGGSVALKGSDGADIRDRALALGAELRAPGRVRRALGMLQEVSSQVHLYCWGGDMGEAVCADLRLPHTVCGRAAHSPSDAGDTREAAAALAERAPDILLFAGGDGTARDVLDSVGQGIPVLGIPCGVKMHSGVFAISPEAAGELLLLLVAAGLVDVQLREVRDIDEVAFREGRVNTRFYGELLVPEVGGYLQQTKVAGRESEELVAQEIAADFHEAMEMDCTYLIGPGSTTAAIMEELGLPGTLLGVDAIRGGELLLQDATAAELESLLESSGGPARIVVTAIGGQGHIFGRGNQQISPAVIRLVGVENILVVAGKGKITGLQGRPLLVDSNDPELDRALSGYRRVITGYHDAILYPVSAVGDVTES